MQKASLHLEREGILNESLLKRMRTCFLALSIACYFSIPLQRDLDRGLKILLDSRCNGLGANDTRGVELHLSKRIRPQDPHVYKETE